MKLKWRYICLVGMLLLNACGQKAPFGTHQSLDAAQSVSTGEKESLWFSTAGHLENQIENDSLSSNEEKQEFVKIEDNKDISSPEESAGYTNNPQDGEGNSNEKIWVEKLLNLETGS